MIVLGIILLIVFLPELISGLMAVGALALSLITGLFGAIFNLFK